MFTPGNYSYLYKRSNSDTSRDRVAPGGSQRHGPCPEGSPVPFPLVGQVFKFRQGDVVSMIKVLPCMITRVNPDEGQLPAQVTCLFFTRREESSIIFQSFQIFFSEHPKFTNLQSKLNMFGTFSEKPWFHGPIAVVARDSGCSPSLQGACPPVRETLVPTLNRALT